MKRLLAFASGFLLVGTLLAQANTTSATAAGLQWGQKVWSKIDGTGVTLTQFWFQMTVRNDRSYCVETAQVQSLALADQHRPDTTLTVYESDGTTVIVNNDDADKNEPRGGLLSRACWIPPANGTNFIKLAPLENGDPNMLVEMRFVETTLFCPWFFIAGDYNAFSLIRNTSSSILNGIVITWNGLSGAVAGTTTVSVPANGTVIVNARDFVDPATFSNGSVVITHAGSPQQLVGSTTTLSGTTGLGFDALFSQREPW